MEFLSMLDTERKSLVTALRENAERDRGIVMNPRDTRFVGTADEVSDEEVVIAIRSVPCHY
jgi:hypothetical protein